jgi:hypothetical protein
MNAPCQHCQAIQGFYRLSGGVWCNACGHRKGERKELAHAPTTGPEIQIRNLARARTSQERT